MNRVLAFAILVGLATPAAACINDGELPSHEREFRSNYGEPTPPKPTTVPNLAGITSHPMLLGAGAALLTGAFVVTMNGKRARK